MFFVIVVFLRIFMFVKFCKYLILWRKWYLDLSLYTRNNSSRSSFLCIIWGYRYSGIGSCTEWNKIVATIFDKQKERMGTIKHNTIFVTGADYAMNKNWRWFIKSLGVVWITSISNNKKLLERLSKFLRCSRWQQRRMGRISSLSLYVTKKKLCYKLRTLPLAKKEDSRVFADRHRFSVLIFMFSIHTGVRFLLLTL